MDGIIGVAVLAGVMMMFAQGCFFFQITPFFWNVQEVGDVEGALRFLPWVIGLLLGGTFVARLALRFGARTNLGLQLPCKRSRPRGAVVVAGRLAILGHDRPDHLSVPAPG